MHHIRIFSYKGYLAFIVICASLYKNDNALRDTLAAVMVAAPNPYFAIRHRKARCRVSGFSVCLEHEPNGIWF